MASERYEVRVSPSRVALVLLAIAVLLLVAHVAAHGVDQAFGVHLPGRAIGIWDINQEDNIPTWFASLLLALVGGGLALVGMLKYQERNGDYWQWLALALIPLSMSVDEMAQLHEALGDTLSDSYGFSGPLHYAWIVAAAPAVLILTILFIPFIRRLPGRTAILLLAGAGTTFVGAFIIEIPEGWWADAHGEGGVVWFVLSTAEEMLEMIGSVMSLYAVMDYVAGYRPEVTVHVQRDELPFPQETERRTLDAAALSRQPAERS
jgi:hypothetical protein